MIEAVIWDMGGILYKTPFEVFEQVEAERGWPPGTLPRGPFAPGGDPEYAKCSTGELTESAYWSGYERTLAARGYALRLVDAIDWTDQLRPEVMDTIHTLHGAVKQATLSNDSSMWLGDDWWETWPYAHMFTALIDVKTLGVRKPHPGAFLTAAARLEVEPAQCLFIDDMRVNVEGAEAVGMEGFFFDHLEPARACRRLLRRLGAA